MMKNKIGTVFLVSILALAGVGVSFAGLSDTITVFGSVSTATVEFEIAYSGTDVWKVYGPTAPDDEVVIWTGFSDDPERPTKESLETQYSGCTAELVASSWAMPGTNGYDVDVVYDNIFPCVPFKANIAAHYIGTIPAHVTISALTWDSGYDFSNYLEFYAYLTEGNSIGFPVQMHYCDTLTIEVTIELLQLNQLQDLSGTFSFDIEAIQWNDECNGDQFEPKILNLPVMSDVKLGAGNYGANSYWNVYPQLDPYPNGYSYPLNVEDFTVLGWCVDEGHTINANTIYDDVKYYSSLNFGSPDPNLWPVNGPTGNDNEPAGYTAWDCINYILNHKQGTKQQQQEALWYFMDGTTYPGPGIVQDMINDASNPTLLSAWLIDYPQQGDWVAVLLDFGNWPGTSTHYQWIFIEVDP